VSSNVFSIDDDPFILGHVGQSLRYALSHGNLVHVSQVASGKGDGSLRCPECGEVMLARKGTKRAHHFAHLSSVSISGCGIESAAHLKAKEVIIEAGWVNGRRIVDYWTFRDFPFEGGWQVELFPAGKIFFPSAEPEVSVGSRRVDVMAFGTTDSKDAIVGPQMAIEICATHKVDESKQSDLKDLDIPTLEIFLDPRMPIRESEFRDHVLRGARRIWKVPPPTDAQREQAQIAYSERLQELQAERDRQAVIEAKVKTFAQLAERTREQYLMLFGPEAVGRLHDATLVALADLPEDLHSEDVVDEHFEAKRSSEDFQTCASDWDARDEFFNVWGYLLCARLIGEGRIPEKSERSAMLFDDLQRELGDLGVCLASFNSHGYDLSSRSDWIEFFEIDPIVAQAHSSILVRALIGINTHEALGEPDLSHYMRDVPIWLEPTGLELSVATGLNRGTMSAREIGRFMEGQHFAKWVLRDEAVRDACRKLLARMWGIGSSLLVQLNLSEEEGIGSQCIMMVQKIFRLDEGLFPPRSKDHAINALRKTWRMA